MWIDRANIIAVLIKHYTIIKFKIDVNESTFYAFVC